MTYEALGHQTRDLFVGHVNANLLRFTEYLDAVRVICDDESSPTTQEAPNLFQRAASKLLGDAGADEVTFALATYVRALRLVQELNVQGEPSDLRRDAELMLAFRAHAALHAFGLLTIQHASEENTHPTLAAIEGAFEIARGGALYAYADVREALALRRPQGVVGDDPEGVFDDEDARLADAG